MVHVRRRPQVSGRRDMVKVTGRTALCQNCLEAFAHSIGADPAGGRPLPRQPACALLTCGLNRCLRCAWCLAERASDRSPLWNDFMRLHETVLFVAISGFSFPARQLPDSQGPAATSLHVIHTKFAWTLLAPG